MHGALLAWTICLTGCSTMEVTKDRKQAIDTYAHRQERAGMVVAVQPVTDRAEQGAWFKSNLAAKGVLPVLVMVETGRPRRASSWEGVRSTSPTRRTVLARPSTMARSPIRRRCGHRGGWCGADRPARHAGRTQDGVRCHGHRTQPGRQGALQPHPRSRQEAHGFAYFQFPKGTPITPNHRVVVDLLNPKSASLRFDFDLR